MSSTKSKQKQSPHPDLLEKLEWYCLVCAQKNLDGTAKALAGVLALKHHNRSTGRCDPSVETLAEGVGRTTRTVIAALAALREAGWITWTGTGRSNRYRLEHVPLRPDVQQTTHHGDEVRYEADCTSDVKPAGVSDVKPASPKPVSEPRSEPVSISAPERAEADTHRSASGGPAKAARRPRQRPDDGTPLPANLELDEHRSGLMVRAGLRQDELREAFDDFVAHALDTGRHSHHWDAALTRWSSNRARRHDSEARQQPEKSKRTSRYQIL